MSTTLPGPRRPRKCVVASGGSTRTGDGAARALAQGLTELGVETRYLDGEQSARGIAVAAIDEGADTVELCLGSGAVLLLRELLRELTECGRRDVSIVVHRVE